MALEEKKLRSRSRRKRLVDNFLGHQPNRRVTARRSDVNDARLAEVQLFTAARGWSGTTSALLSRRPLFTLLIVLAAATYSKNS